MPSVPNACPTPGQGTEQLGLEAKCSSNGISIGRMKPEVSDSPSRIKFFQEYYFVKKCIIPNYIEYKSILADFLLIG